MKFSRVILPVTMEKHFFHHISPKNNAKILSILRQLALLVRASRSIWTGCSISFPVMKKAAKTLRTKMRGHKTNDGTNIGYILMSAEKPFLLLGIFSTITLPHMA